MKKTLLFGMLLCAAVSSGQVINIPDPVFKDALLLSGNGGYVARDANDDVMIVDTNADGEIDQSEALGVYRLTLSSQSLASLEGIEYFTNLVQLACIHSALTSLDVSALSNLNRLQIGWNDITDLNITGLSNLEKLEAVGNNLSSIDFTGVTGLEELNFNSNAFSTIDLSALVSLKKLEIFDNDLTSLDVSMLSTLEFIEVGYCPLTSLNVTGLQNLHGINCHYTELASLDLTGLTGLKNLNCFNSQLTSLDVTPAVNLESLSCNENLLTSLEVHGLEHLGMIDFSGNQLTTVDLSGLPILESLLCSDNPLVTLNFDDLTSLQYVQCSNTMLTEIDLSHSPLVWLLDIVGNTVLEHINLKNGGMIEFPTDTTIDDNPNLTLICIDEGEEEAIAYYVAEDGTPYSTYCTFAPGSPYNTITGVVAYDQDGNGCEALDPVHSLMPVRIDDGAEQAYSYTNMDGGYTFYTQAGEFTLEPQFENNAFTVTPGTVTFDQTGQSAVQDFCIEANGVFADAEVVVVPTSVASTGFMPFYKIIYRNKGNQVLSGSLTLSYDDTIMDLFSSDIAPDSQATGILTYNFTNLQPFENREINIRMDLNSPSDTPAINIGDMLTYDASISISMTDEVPADNAFTLEQEVVGSFDPNDIVCLEGDTEDVEAIGEYLHYTVNFENTGNYPATFVVVKHEIDPAQFDISTLQLLNSSHNVMASVTGNKAEFIFEDINLAALERGNITFKIKTLQSLSEGDAVANEANIFFDYNLPILTNEAATVFEATAGLGEHVDASVAVYPNPTNGFINITADSNLTSLRLYDLQGRLLQTVLPNNTNAVLDMASRATGVYLLKVTSEKGMKVEKIINE